tara:strand:- start:3036 stop:3764 length:729 start_codon:yes stop_codon:yes gene_type:complete
MASIDIKNISVKFRIYHEKLPQFKDFLINLLKLKTSSQYSDFFALKDFSLKLKEGSRLGIVGPNGAGKSTLLKTICNIYTPTNGKINVNGTIAPLLEIGAGFHPEYTGRENLHLNASILGFTKEEIKLYEEEIIEFSGIKNFIDTPVKYYSTGMYLRLGFSIASFRTPDILIMDEMFAGGDNDFLEKAKKRLYEIINDSKIVILVSHDFKIIEQFCDSVLRIENGKKVFYGSIQDHIDKFGS